MKASDDLAKVPERDHFITDLLALGALLQVRKTFPRRSALKPTWCLWRHAFPNRPRRDQSQRSIPAIRARRGASSWVGV